MSEIETTTTTFDRIEIGQHCRVMLGGRLQTVTRTRWLKCGSTAYNARKDDGRGGRTFVYSDAVVEVVE